MGKEHTTVLQVKEQTPWSSGPSIFMSPDQGDQGQSALVILTFCFLPSTACLPIALGTLAFHQSALLLGKSVVTALWILDGLPIKVKYPHFSFPQAF